MLQIHADDPAFLQMVRHSDPEQSAPHTLAACRQQITQLRDAIEAATGLEARFRQQLLGDIKAVEDALQPLEHGTPATGRALKSLANLVNLWPLLVPSPLLGNQAKTFAYSIAAATKGVMTLSASALRPTSDGLPFPLMGGQLGRDANEMHFYSVLLNGLFLTTELPKKFGTPSMRHQAETVENNLGFAAAASTACAAMVLTPFLWNSLNVLGNRLQHKLSHLGAGMAESAGFQSQAQRLRARLTPGQISAQLRTQLNEITAALESGREAFQQARRDFTDPSQGRELTRTLNAQCTHLLQTLDQCSKRLSTALQVDQDGPATIPRQVTNHDIAPKLALALLGAGVTGLTVYLIQPDRIGTVDLLADSVVVTAVMMQSAANAHATRQDAMERFKAMCSGSLVMALALGVEKLSKTFADKSLIEASSASPYYAGAIMSLMSMSMPGPMARGAELAMNWGGGQIMRVLRGPTVPRSQPACRPRPRNSSRTCKTPPDMCKACRRNMRRSTRSGSAISPCRSSRTPARRRRPHPAAASRSPRSTISPISRRRTMPPRWPQPVHRLSNARLRTRIGRRIRPQPAQRLRPDGTSAGHRQPPRACASVGDAQKNPAFRRGPFAATAEVAWIRNPCRPCRPCHRRPASPARPSSVHRPPWLRW